MAGMSLTPGLPELHVDGARLADPEGHTVLLRGCNLGNWFMIEHWIWDESQPEGSSQDQYELEQILARRFGRAEEQRLMDIYRSSWITDRDFDIIKSFRFNCVRLPLNYRQFEDDSNPYHLKADAWKWTDYAVRLAARHGIYVILDMHGAQGGQSPYDHTGRINQNKLWTDPENSKRLAWLWGEIAKRYRHDPTVVAYDAFNEPYGGEFPQIRREFERTFASIRKVDPDKLVWAHGRYDGFDFYGSPRDNGWHNVGIQMHYYPGLFGNGAPTIKTNAQHLDSLKREVEPKVKALGVPFFIGEMNVVFKSAGGAQMMRRTFDLHESFGWNTTMWCYKALSRSGGIHDATWGMVTNKNPIPEINFATSPKSNIEAFFRSHATMPYDVYEELCQTMSPVHIELPPLPAVTKRLTAPQGTLSAWEMADVGGSLKGGLDARTVDFDLYGGGADIWGVRDQFRYLYQTVDGDFDAQVRIDKLEDLGSYCKAGLMMRENLDPASPHVLISSFPSGELQLASRSQPGGDTQGGVSKEIGLPVWVQLERRGATVVASYRKSNSGGWTELGRVTASGLPNRVFIGAVALSHDNGELVKATYSNLSVRE